MTQNVVVADLGENCYLFFSALNLFAILFKLQFCVGRVGVGLKKLLVGDGQQLIGLKVNLREDAFGDGGKGEVARLWWPRGPFSKGQNSCIFFH